MQGQSREHAAYGFKLPNTVTRLRTDLSKEKEYISSVKHVRSDFKKET